VKERTDANVQAEMALEATSLGGFLEALAARTPAPAGGGAAGVSAAMGAALLAMVARYSTGERFREIEAQMQALVEELSKLEKRALASVRKDEEAFGAVAAAYARAQATEEERAARSAAIQEAMLGAIASPIALGELCDRLAEIARVLAARANRNVISDLATGAACVAAALDGCMINVTANAASLRDQDVRARTMETVSRLTATRDALRTLVEETRARFAHSATKSTARSRR
jgi:formiminotetrahydrofolate cyclodeaminase